MDKVEAPSAINLAGEGRPYVLLGDFPLTEYVVPGSHSRPTQHCEAILCFAGIFSLEVR